MSPIKALVAPAAHAGGEYEDVIILRGRELKITVAYVDQMSLRFFAENPRIYSSIWREDGPEPTQAEIFEVLSKRENVREILLPRLLPLSKVRYRGPPHMVAGASAWA